MPASLSMAVTWTITHMIRLPKSVAAWGKPEFNGVLRNELGELGARQLPLQQGLSSGSHALDSRVEAMIISSSDDAGRIHVRAGIFYSSIIAGCSCADDPTPVDEHAEYCEVILVIDKATGETVVTLPE
jgi:hypothetical protein